MLKISSIRDDGEERRLFWIQDEGAPASLETLDQVTVYAARLLEENELPGEYRVFSEGCLALNLPTAQRSFFHDGVVFAALDAVNNPTKNVTLTRFIMDEGGSEGEP